MKSSHTPPNADRPVTDVRRPQDTTPDPLEEGGSIETGEGLRPLALAGLTLTSIVLCVILAVPVLPAITWGVALAILALPMHRWIVRRVRWPGLAAGLSSAVVVGVILGTMSFVTYQLSQEARSAVKRVGSGANRGNLLEQAEKLPVIGPAVRWMEGAGLDFEAEARKRLATSTQQAGALAQGSMSAILQFLVAVFILFYLLKEPKTFLDGMRGMLPMTRVETNLIFTRAADSVHANLHATLVTSIIDTIGFAILFWWVGFPAWILWSSVMFILSLMPILGAGVVWVPAVAYLALSSHWVGAGAVLAWGVFTFILVDNALYARLAGGRMKMHEVPALIAFLGGLAVFGMSGIILGPLILAVAVGLMDVWKRRIAMAG